MVKLSQYRSFHGRWLAQELLQTVSRVSDPETPAYRPQRRLEEPEQRPKGGVNRVEGSGGRWLHGSDSSDSEGGWHPATVRGGHASLTGGRISNGPPRLKLGNTSNGSSGYPRYCPFRQAIRIRVVVAVAADPGSEMIMFVKFHDAAIVVEDASVSDSYRRSVHLVRSNLRSVLGFSLTWGCLGERVSRP